ncbi:hypothetical protein CDCA_CDCA14G3904 [Cyanidium caldarium]|uniref:HSF-type DNA-binding domain-containing protein n=1 Tax=Cyanidium caldarium TaxID=2771 RepID=A0AAV9J000_CYACA|nr:hypothetical protein CDCA_CDCA14G3904 [Cyanidium caldarium]
MADTSPPPESPAILLPLVLKLLAVIRSDHPPQCIGWTDDGTAVQVLDIPEFVRRYLASAAWPPYRTWEQWVQVLRQHGFGVQIGRDGTAARLEHAVWSRQQLELLAQHSQWQRHRLRQSAASPLRMNLPSSALSVPVATTAAAAAVAATRTCAVDDSGPATDSDVEDLLDDATDFEDEVDAGEPAEADRGAASGNGSRSRGYSPPAIGLSASAADVSRTSARTPPTSPSERKSHASAPPGQTQAHRSMIARRTPSEGALLPEPPPQRLRKLHGEFHGNAHAGVSSWRTEPTGIQRLATPSPVANGGRRPSPFNQLPTIFASNQLMPTAAPAAGTVNLELVQARADLAALRQANTLFLRRIDQAVSQVRQLCGLAAEQERRLITMEARLEVLEHRAASDAGGSTRPARSGGSDDRGRMTISTPTMRR